MDYAEIKQRVGMTDLLGAYSVEVIKGHACCPIHGGDNKKGFHVTNDDQAWKCFSGDCGGGDIFTFVEKMDKIDNSAGRLKIMDLFNLSEPAEPARKPKPKPVKKQKAAVVKRTEYIYRSEAGKELYKVLRIDYADGKKDCFQECNGSHTLPKAVRTLYNLDKIKGNLEDYIFLCEGEKAADALTECGYIGTTNPLGSGNWDSSYAKLLSNQKVVIMPDADEQGEKWRNAVLADMRGIVESVVIIQMPDEFIAENPEFKGHDIADYVQINGIDETIDFIMESLSESEVLPRGVKQEILGRPSDTWADIKRRARAGISTNIFNMSDWLPSMNINVKEGDLIVLMANTSTGKTRILHNLPFHIKRLNFAVFDLELSQDTLAVRYAAMENNMSVTALEKRLEMGMTLKDVCVDNVFIQKITNLTVERIKERVELIELVTGQKIHGVAVDYIGLMSGNGSKYEATSNNVEEFKAYIGASDKFGVLTTQVSRPMDKENGMFECPSPFSAKNSGSIENSSQTLIGIWKDKDSHKRLWARIMKHTHGEYYQEDIALDANDLLITEDTRTTQY